MGERTHTVGEQASIGATDVVRAIRAAIPNATEDECGFIIWNRTSFPFSALNAREIYRAASSYRRATDNGRTLCDHCDNQAIEGSFCCAKCLAALARATKE